MIQSAKVRKNIHKKDRAVKNMPYENINELRTDCGG